MTTDFEKTRQESETQLEKQVIYISGGGLGLTLTLLEKIIQRTNEEYLCFVKYALLSFAITLILNLLTHFFTKIAIELRGKFFRPFAIIAHILQFVSLITLIAGVIFTIAYTLNFNL